MTSIMGKTGLAGRRAMKIAIAEAKARFAAIMQTYWT